MSNRFVIATPGGCIRHNIPPWFTVQHVHGSDGELSAVTVQREPRPIHRIGGTGILQQPEPRAMIIYSGVTLGIPWSRIVSVPESTLLPVYGISPGILPEPEPSEPEPAAEPLPVDCHASNYVSEFRELCVKLATRNIWKVQRQSAHVDADDIAQDAVALLLDHPERYATEPLEAGASAAVNDAIRNEQGSELKRAVKFEPLAIDCGLSAPVETIPSDYETEADALSRLVGRSLAIHAALQANAVEVETHADACGISARTVARRRSEIRNSLVAIALSELSGNLR